MVGNSGCHKSVFASLRSCSRNLESSHLQVSSNVIHASASRDCYTSWVIESKSVHQGEA